MKTLTVSVLFLSSLLLAACGKKAEQAASEEAPPPAAASAQSASSPAPAAEPSAEDRERAKKQALMDYATMEDQYINDARAQWAASGKASSTFGDDRGDPAQSSLASNIAGPVDSKAWTNNKLDVGMDWLEAGFAKPVSATEVRVVFEDGAGVEAVSKLELQDTQGSWHTVWSGLSDVKIDQRGSRTWFVKSFEKTPYQANAAKVTVANNVYPHYKKVDAVQLVGE